MKEYQKPEIEIISLLAREPITKDDLNDGDMDLESSLFPDEE